MVLFLLLPFSMLLFRDTLGTLSTQPCKEDDQSSSAITGTPNAPSGLMCYRHWKGDKPFQCTWNRGKDLAEYQLCYCCDTCKICRSFVVGNETSYIVPRDDLYLNKNLTFWVETIGGHRKVKSAKLYVVPETTIKYEPLSNKEIKLRRSANFLTLRWNKPENMTFNEIRYRKKSSQKWNKINCSSSERKTHENCTIQLDSSSAHQIQIRRILQDIWSEWSSITFIPAAITKKLDLQWRFIDEYQCCPGKRMVELMWQPLTEPDVKVMGYKLTFRPMINATNYCIKVRNATSYKTLISLASYKVSIVAYNRAGTSPTETITIPAAQHSETPDLNLTAVDNRTLRVSWIPRSFNFYCAFLEQVSTRTVQHHRCQSIKHLGFKQKKGHHRSTVMEFVGLEPLRRYRLTIYANDSKERNKCHKKFNYVIDFASACTQEEPPTHGPSVVNVTNIMKSSVSLQWKKIALGECQGILEKYRIIYTDIQNHTHTVSVNSSVLNFTLTNLNASTLYTVQICGVTTVGQGAKIVRTFQTKEYDPSELMAIIVATSFIVMLAVFTVFSLCYLGFKRTKRMVCPTVPDPVNSLAVKSMHFSDHISQWEVCSTDEDVTDVLLVIASLQSDVASPSETATDDALSMREDSNSLSDTNSLGFGSNSGFEYRRQMGCSFGLEEDCSSETGGDMQLETQSPGLETCHICPLGPEIYSDSGLNLGGNMISLLSVYDQMLGDHE
ncbi:interleukin-12 receptor subunit beta-1-like isoform X2 [Narcine bancroftii]|uniref:interleukin-12 receptor subunit beta-1-like isoform X2 n=1 Tax=Narcine bancroftii TaxID=1343680 RepID=UPI0038322E03